MNGKRSLSMEERVERLNKQLLERDANFTIRFTTVWKNNSEYEGYILESKTHNCAPTIYKNEWFFKSDMEVIDFLQEFYDDYARDIDVKSVTDREYILNHILPRLVSYNNKERIEKNHIAYVGFLDMLVLFYVPIEEFSEDVLCSLQVTETMLKQNKISLTESCLYAVENLEKQVDIKPMGEMLFELCEQAVEMEDYPMYVATNKTRCQGAAVLLCSSVLKILEEKMGGKVVVLPSSIHEIIAFPFDGSLSFEALHNLVKEVNTSSVTEEERLTDSVYIIEDGELKMAI